MVRFAGILGLMSLAACGDNSSDSGAETGTTGTSCGNTVSETFPIDGATDAFYRTNVEFTLVTAEASATVDVTDASGTSVAGTTAIDANRVTWTPSEAMQPSTAYTATLTWSCDPVSISFTTTDTGGAVGDPSTLVNNTYQLPLTEGRFVKPPGIGDLIGGLISVDVLMMVTAADAAHVHFMGAVSDDSGTAQDLCTESIDFPEDADFTQNPFFSVGPDTTTLNVAGYDITVTNLSISGAFTADGGAIQGAALGGSIDTRPLVDLVAPGGGDDGVCSLVSTFGINCVDCVDGSGTYCLEIQVEDMSAVLIPGLQLQLIDQAAIDANASCAAATTN